MCGKAEFLFLLAVVVLYHDSVVNGIQTHSIQKRNLALEEITCIRNEFTQSNTNPSCTTVEAGIESLFEADDVLVAISTRLDLFDTFCLQSCGQLIIDALGACGIYSRVKNEAELLIGLCAANNGRSCHNDYVQLFAAFSDGSDCFDDLESTSSCSINCRSSLTLDVQNYGCCTNVVIDYIDAIDTFNDVNTQADILFSNCRVPRPADCAPSALGPPGNGAGQPTAAAAILLLASFVTVLMHL